MDVDDGPAGLVGEQQQVDLGTDEDAVLHVQQQAAQEGRRQRNQLHT